MSPVVRCNMILRLQASRSSSVSSTRSQSFHSRFCRHCGCHSPRRGRSSSPPCCTLRSSTTASASRLIRLSETCSTVPDAPKYAVRFRTNSSGLPLKRARSSRAVNPFVCASVMDSWPARSAQASVPPSVPTGRSTLLSKARWLSGAPGIACRIMYLTHQSTGNSYAPYSNTK